MKEYIVRKTSGGIVVWRDGERIEMKGLFDAIAKPRYDYGKQSESAMNLGYAILCDCVGEAATGRLNEDFNRINLMVESMEISIPVDEIMAWAKRKAKQVADAQNKSG